jgi:aldose 1-epimerase
VPPKQTLELSAGNLALGLSPSVGGAIAWFEWRGKDSRRPLLRRRNNSPEIVLEAASFPLVPFVNRIRGGRFDFRDRQVRLAPNMAGDPSPLHGQGWLNPWCVDRAGDRDAALSFVHEAGEWPWAYEARQEFALDAQGLSVRLTCTNRSEQPMPCGLGQHPYFECGPETRIDTQVAHAWTIDEHVLPVEKVPAEGRFDLSNRLVCGQELDHGFDGWGGAAMVSDPEWPFTIRMSSPNAKFFQLYSPAGGGIFVAEPVTHANAALNQPKDRWAELGIRVLEPGDAMSLDMRLSVAAR